MDFGMCKNGWSAPEYNHLGREKYGKLEDSVDIKPEGTWDSRSKEESLKETYYRHYCL